jgi:large subunit ribosomal protein L6
MSRIGKMAVKIPSGVTVAVDAGNVVRVKGPKGELAQEVNPAITVCVEDGAVKVARPDDEKKNKAMHGLYRSLIANMVTGVTQGYSKELEIVGTGYRAALQGAKLVLNVGYSHQVEIPPPAGITFESPAPNKVIVRGFDKHLVGETAAGVRRVRSPEPYMGKGIRYLGETVKIKEGKAAGK